MKRFALTHCTYFDADDQEHHEQAVIVSHQRIEQILPMSELPEGLDCVDCSGQLLTPGFIDIQVNGGGGVMFNNQPTLAGLEAIRRGHWSGGTTAMLPTLITDSDAIMSQAVDAVAQAIEQLPGILGIHLEGPHLNLEKRGVHAADKVRLLADFSEQLLQCLPPERYLITVAPECLPAGTIARWVARGIRVSAGHTLADYAQIQQALAEGLACFTHLYNAMTPMASREPGVVGAALEDEQTYCGLIVDGIHLHPAVAKLAVRTKPTGKMLLVTDAMAVVGSSVNSFELYGETIYAVDGRCAKADGTLAGSALDMASAVRHCVHTLELALPEALRMASLYPAQFLGLADQYARLASTYRADLVLLDADLCVQKTWVAGELVYSKA
ncbi:MAG: N-acetylglucosamine-6-phosphate deacetylase [Proteobacteria bacterium]|nr:MAG: N-acetylglucosamine-6-phosphate deacetylase [Pseudomonadota bacterium]